MKITRNGWLAIVATAAISTTLAGTSFGFTANVSGTNGANVNNYANGQIVDQLGVSMANWTLNTTAGTTDFTNDAIQGGPDGLQYVMKNDVGGSTDANRIGFFVTPMVASDNANISLSQSPYHQLDTWNGGDMDVSQFIVTWNDSLGPLSIADPNNQLATVNDGQLVTASPALIRFSSNRIFNSNDAWSIDLPSRASNVEVEWSSSNPQNGSTLTREWITFDANVAAGSVPEPSSGSMLTVAGLFALACLRRRR